MSKDKDDEDRSKDSGDEKPYKVGNKRPPKEFQFKSGASGNPSGRPKGRTKFGDVVFKELKKKVTATMGGQPIKITNEAIFASQLVKAGITKGPQSAGLLVSMIEKVEARRAAEEAARVAKQAEEPMKEFTWAQAQEELYQELKRYAERNSGGDNIAENEDDGSEPREEPPDELP
jgi:hypothetical protein